MRSREVSVSSGKRMAPPLVSDHVRPRSSERNTCGPQCGLVAPASILGGSGRTSSATE